MTRKLGQIYLHPVKRLGKPLGYGCAVAEQICQAVVALLQLRARCGKREPEPAAVHAAAEKRDARRPKIGQPDPYPACFFIQKAHHGNSEHHRHENARERLINSERHADAQPRAQREHELFCRRKLRFSVRHAVPDAAAEQRKQQREHIGAEVRHIGRGKRRHGEVHAQYPAGERDARALIYPQHLRHEISRK